MCNCQGCPSQGVQWDRETQGARQDGPDLITHLSNSKFESDNHITTELFRLEKLSELMKSNCSPALLRPPLIYVPKCHVHTAFEHLQGWGLSHSSQCCITCRLAEGALCHHTVASDGVNLAKRSQVLSLLPRTMTLPKVNKVCQILSQTG